LIFSPRGCSLVLTQTDTSAAADNSLQSVWHVAVVVVVIATITTTTPNCVAVSRGQLIYLSANIAMDDYDLFDTCLT